MRIISTIGDPNGIGIECLYKSIKALIANEDSFAEIELEIAGNTSIIDNYLKMLDYDYSIEDDYLTVSGRKFKIHQACEEFDVKFGELSKAAGSVAATSIEYAMSYTICGDFDAMLTMPISKEAIRLAGRNFPGHTEMIAAACSIRNPLMILFHNDVRVGLVSTHTAISEVHYEITCSKIIQIATIFNNSLQSDFGFDNPRIAVLGLNPHAGENGNIGREELEIIIPAIATLKSRGIDVNGPFPADGFFGFGEYEKYDGILAMYHDQGLIPLKLLAKGDGVNFTAGLPIIRTSPDHGTAFALAGKNLANSSSTISAILNAAEIYWNRLSVDR